MKIEWNKEANTISVGEAVFSTYQNFKSCKIWAHTVLLENKLSIPGGHPKEYNKAIADALGCSAPVLYKHFRALQYKAFVVPYKELLMKLAFSRGRVNCGALKKIAEAHPLLVQAQQDGLTHILPLIMETNKSPQELKKELGNTWKVLTKNTLGRNKVIAAQIRVIGRLDAVKSIIGIPSTVLKVYEGHSIDFMNHVTSHYKGRWGKVISRKESETFQDTRYLAEQLETKFDPLWTPRRMKEEHDRMSKEILARRYSPEKLKVLDNVPVKELEHKGYVATLLDSAQLIAQEGEAMGHCVAGYADSVRQGRYLVYSITKGGERSSTLGINVRRHSIISESDPDLNRKDVEYRYSQHYGRFNRSVTDLAEKEIAQELLIAINPKIELKTSQASVEWALEAA